MANLMEVTLVSRYAEQICINRWNYLTSSTPASVSLSFGLVAALGAIVGGAATAFETDSMLEIMRNQQSDAVSYSEILARDVYSDTDFYTTPIPTTVVGEQTGQGASPMTAWGFVTNRTRSDIRRATKRFVGCVEADIDALGLVSAARLAGLEVLATAMADDVTYDDEGTILTFQPCVVKKEKYHPPDNPTGWAYRYNENEAEQFENLMTSILWQPYTSVRSQTSRQYNRGR